MDAGVILLHYKSLMLLEIRLLQNLSLGEDAEEEYQY